MAKSSDTCLTTNANICQLALVLGEKSLRSLEVRNNSSIRDAIFARQAKQIASRLYKMGEEKLAEPFYEDAAILTIINMWNDELQESDYSFLMQDITAAILEGETK